MQLEKEIGPAKMLFAQQMGELATLR